MKAGSSSTMLRKRKLKSDSISNSVCLATFNSKLTGVSEQINYIVLTIQLQVNLFIFFIPQHSKQAKFTIHANYFWIH